ncbi:MAG: hypothetical protein E7465_04390 [Ruminococcaceae bacterium]|nr:hypothetical protein [Oscillospiraceae bacterium]
MRRIPILIFTLLLVFSLSLPVFAVESGAYPTAGDLWEHWCETETIPDFITGIWSSDGGTENLTFGIIPGQAGEAGKNLILSWIMDDSTVTFVTQTYSRNYLWAIMEDVNTYFDRGLGFLSAGPSEYDNVVYVELHMDYAENPDSLAAVAELEERYGGAVSISFTDTEYVALLAPAASSDPFQLLPVPQKAPSPLPILLTLSIIMLCLIFLTERRRRLLLMGGGTVPVTYASVRERIKDAVPKYPDTLDARICESLDKLSQ